MRTTRSILGFLTVCCLAVPFQVFAEGSQRPGADSRKLQVRFGGGAILGTPTGEFRDHFDVGGGVAGHALLATPGSVFALRLDGSWLLYGSETLRAPVSDTGGRVLVDVARTDNWIAHASAGPQIMVRSGPFRPYAHAFAGVAYFSTTSEPVAPPPFATISLPIDTTHLDDVSFSYGAGAGIVIPLGSGRTALDVGARYFSSDRVSLLTKGDLRDDGNGGVTFTPQRADGNVVELRVGITMLR